MKFIYLAAGKNNFHLDGREEKPKCLSSFTKDSTIIDKILVNLRTVGIKDIYVVGGYQILAILKSHPKLKYFYNDQWEETKSLYSLKIAETEFNDDLLVSYSDIVYNHQLLNDLMAKNTDISIGYDSEWIKRYAGRNEEMLNEAEKIILTKNNKIKVDKNIETGVNVIGEFMGVFRVNRSLSNVLSAEINSLLLKENSASVCDLINILAQKYSVSLVDVKGHWAELDTPQDLFQFKFGTKAETLKKLENKLKHSKVLQQIKFTVKDYEDNSDLVISNIQSKFKSQKLVVRSSALNEDTHSSSMAGNYESILNVITLEKSSISNAIDLVIDSYLKGGQNKVLYNQILVQPQLEAVQMSGVAFTKDLETSAPYYTIKIDPKKPKRARIENGRVPYFLQSSNNLTIFSEIVILDIII